MLKKTLKCVKIYLTIWLVCGIILSPIVYINNGFFWKNKNKPVFDLVKEIIFSENIIWSFLFTAFPILVSCLLYKFCFRERLWMFILFVIIYIYITISGFLYFKGYVFVAALIILIVTYLVAKKRN